MSLEDTESECTLKFAVADLARRALYDLALNIMSYGHPTEVDGAGSPTCDCTSLLELSIRLTLLLSFIAVSEDPSIKEVARKLLRIAIYASAMMASDAVKWEDVVLAINNAIDDLKGLTAECEE